VIVAQSQWMALPGNHSAAKAHNNVEP